MMKTFLIITGFLGIWVGLLPPIDNLSCLDFIMAGVCFIMAATIKE